MKIKLTRQSSRGTGQYILPGNQTLSGQQIELMLTIIVNGPHKFCQYSARSADFGKNTLNLDPLPSTLCTVIKPL